MLGHHPTIIIQLDLRASAVSAVAGAVYGTWNQRDYLGRTWNQGDLGRSWAQTDPMGRTWVLSDEPASV